MKFNSRFWIATAIILIVNGWAITAMRASLYSGGDPSFSPHLSAMQMTVMLLLIVMLDISTLFYLFVKTLSSQRAKPAAPTLTPRSVFTAPIVAKVKSHPLPPLRR